MRRLIAVLLVIVMAVTVSGIASADQGRKELADSMVEIAKEIMRLELEQYKKAGKLDDGNLEFAYCYFKLYVDEMRIGSIEVAYPAAFYLNMGADPYANMEEVFDGEWLKYVEGTGDRSKFEKNLMTFIEIILKD